ncbi:MAG: oligosaccharide repeat unit polymerase [Paludibacteraceae bacterium]|nr:oligosaccharide repeat unit polymerase [Paludibacteraceae bacterium]
MDSTISIIPLTINLLLYALTFIAYHNKRKYWSIGTFLLLQCVVLAVLAIASFYAPTSGWKPYKSFLHIFPFIYLYIMFMLAMYPVLKFHEEQYKLTEEPVNFIIVPVIILTLIGFLQIPEIIELFKSSITTLVDSKQGGAHLYAQMRDNAHTSGHSATNILAIIGNSTSEICVFLFVYLHTLKKKFTLCKIGLFSIFACSSVRGLASGSRYIVLLAFISLIACLVLFRPYLTKRNLSNLKTLSIVCIVIAALVVGAITISRFGNNSKNKNATTQSVLWYTGQSMIFFNNNGLDANGIRHGDRTINLFKSFFDEDTPRNYVERRKKYSNMALDDYVFYSFVGDFTLDYGPFWAFIIFIIAAIVLRYKTKVYGNNVEPHKLLLIFIIVNCCLQGSMTLFPYADIGGNLKLILFFIFYEYLKIVHYRCGKQIENDEQD